MVLGNVAEEWILDFPKPPSEKNLAIGFFGTQFAIE